MPPVKQAITPPERVKKSTTTPPKSAAPAAAKPAAGQGAEPVAKATKAPAQNGSKPVAAPDRVNLSPSQPKPSSGAQAMVQGLNLSFTPASRDLPAAKVVSGEDAPAKGKDTSLAGALATFATPAPGQERKTLGDVISGGERAVTDGIRGLADEGLANSNALDAKVREFTGGSNPFLAMGPLGQLEEARTLFKGLGQDAAAAAVPGLGPMGRGFTEGVLQQADGLTQAATHPLDTVQALDKATQSSALDPDGRLAQTLSGFGPGQAVVGVGNLLTNAGEGLLNGSVDAENRFGPGGGLGFLGGSLASPGGLPGKATSAVKAGLRSGERAFLGAEKFNLKLGEAEARDLNLGGQIQAAREAALPLAQKQLVAGGKELVEGGATPPGRIGEFLKNPENLAALQTVDAAGKAMVVPESLRPFATGNVIEGRANILKELERRQGLPESDPQFLKPGQAGNFVNGLLRDSDLGTRPLMFETTPGLTVGRSFTKDFDVRKQLNQGLPNEARLGFAGPMGGYFTPLENLEGRTVKQLQSENGLPVFNHSDAATTAVADGQNLALLSKVGPQESLGTAATGGGTQLQFQNFLRQGNALPDPSRIDPLAARPSLSIPLLTNNLGVTPASGDVQEVEFAHSF